MPGIVCAIRGGPASQPTIDKAIALSGDTGLVLHFLYIVNLDFVVHTATSRTHLISKEMEQMGEFILLKAQGQAERNGVSAQIVIRHGRVSDEIIGLCRELEADYAVLGRPRHEGEQDVFTHDHLGEFARHITEACGAQVIFSD